MNSGSFTITGYSSDEAMTDFTDGTKKISKGKMFAEGTDSMVCVISSELAKYNDLSVGDSIKVSNPNNSKETYKLKIVGIYKNSQSSAQAGQAGPNASDPANNIYTSYETLNQIVTASGKKNSKSTSAISGRLNGTYVVGTLGKYKQFKKEVKQLGLSTKYQVTSADISSYEQSARPLKNLAKFAGCFLIVILLVGAAISLSNLPEDMDAARYHAHFYNRWFRRLKAPASWFYPGELLKDKTKFFIEQSHCPVGVFVNRNFVKASHILVYVASKEDRFLFSYAQTLAKATHGEITVAAE